MGRRAGGVRSGSPPCFTFFPVWDSLLFPVLHGERPHSPNIAQGLIRYARCPGNLQGVQEVDSEVGAGEGWQGAEKRGR